MRVTCLITIYYCSQFVKLYLVVTDLSQSVSHKHSISDQSELSTFFWEASDWSEQQRIADRESQLNC